MPIMNNNKLLFATGSTNLVLINFSVEWCRFSRQLSPIWDNFALKVSKEFAKDQVTVAKVDCDAQKSIAARLVDFLVYEIIVFSEVS